MDSILQLAAQYKIVLAGTGAAGLLAALLCLALNRLEWPTIWARLYPVGKAFDLVLRQRWAWLEKLVEDTIILGAIPALISIAAGMVENCTTLKAKLKTILTEMAAKL